MKNYILAVLLVLSAATFGQTNTGELDRDGRVIYEKTFEDASIEIEETHLIDEDLYRIFDHKGVFRIGAQQGFNTFPFKMLVRNKEERKLLVMNVNYEFKEKNIVITAKNSMDELVFPLGVQYYIVVRYTKK